MLSLCPGSADSVTQNEKFAFSLSREVAGLSIGVSSWMLRLHNVDRWKDAPEELMWAADYTQSSTREVWALSRS